MKMNANDAKASKKVVEEESDVEMSDIDSEYEAPITRSKAKDTKSDKAKKPSRDEESDVEEAESDSDGPNPYVESIMVV